MFASTTFQWVVVSVIIAVAALAIARKVLRNSRGDCSCGCGGKRKPRPHIHSDGCNDCPVKDACTPHSSDCPNNR